MRKTTLAIGLTLILVGAGCNKSPDDAGAGAPAAGETKKVAAAGGEAGGMFPGFDAQSEIKALQGTWKVKDKAFGKDLATWTIEGEKLTVKRGDKVEEGELAIDYPGELAFVKKEGGGTSRSYFAYARNGDEIYIGLGTGGIKAGDAYMVGDDGVVVYSGKTCNYYKKKMFGGFEKPVVVTCAVKTEGERPEFDYQIPDRFKKGEMKERHVGVYGSALLNEQMTGHKAEKVQ